MCCDNRTSLLPFGYSCHVLFQQKCCLLVVLGKGLDGKGSCYGQREQSFTVLTNLVGNNLVVISSLLDY